MRLYRLVYGVLVGVAQIFVVWSNALANGGDEINSVTSTSPLVLVPVGLAVVAVGFVLFKIFRGSPPEP